MTVQILTGDALEQLRTLPDASVQCCVTSPPYWGLRDYGVSGQLGLERTPDEYVTRMVAVFAEVRRVLRDDGTLWLNLGDSYAASYVSGPQGVTGDRASRTFIARTTPKMAEGLKPKDLIGIPWRVAFALQSDGWYLRSEIIWAKPSPMPESVRDRPTKAHEQVFLLSKSATYFYDADAIAEPASPQSEERYRYAFSGAPDGLAGGTEGTVGKYRRTATVGMRDFSATRNARSVWTIATQPYSAAHFATMPPELARRCVLAGSKAGDCILDPFGGAGTTGLVADRLNRDAILIELNPAYVTLAKHRLTDDAPLFVEVSA